MSQNPWSIKPLKIKSMDFGLSPKKKRKTLTSSQRMYIWERPNIYGRACSICHRKITKMSDLELDHKRAHSKGGTKLALAHKDCNRLKSSGSLRKIQKTLGIKPTKRKTTKKKSTKRKPTNFRGINIKPLKISSFKI